MKRGNLKHRIYRQYKLLQENVKVVTVTSKQGRLPVEGFSYVDDGSEAKRRQVIKWRAKGY